MCRQQTLVHPASPPLSPTIAGSEASFAQRGAPGLMRSVPPMKGDVVEAVVCTWPRITPSTFGARAFRHRHRRALQRHADEDLGGGEVEEGGHAGSVARPRASPKGRSPPRREPARLQDVEAVDRCAVESRITPRRPDPRSS